MTPRDFCDIGQQKDRIRLILIILTVLTFIVLARLLYLQTIKHNYYVKIAASQHWAKDAIPAKRGRILVKDDTTQGGYYPLADNQKLELVYGAPEEIKDKKEASTKLAQLIGEDKAKIQDLLENNHTYVVLKHRLGYEQAEKVRDLKITGVYTNPEEVRYYPEGSLASQILGYVDSEGEGKYGLEQFYNDDLSGVPGLYKAEIDPSGKKISFGKNVQVEPKNGSDIILTINRDVQLEAEKIIKQTVEKYSAENGSVIVMNPTSGEIIAMANYPTFDPNSYKEVKDYQNFRNSAVTDEFEPGSIFKIITMAAGLDTGKVQPDTKYEDTGNVTLSGYKIMNSDKKAHGWVDMSYVIQESLNTGVVYVLNQIGKNIFFDYIHKFGFGKKTGLEQPNEGNGTIGDLNNVSITDHTIATMTFGQSLTTTPIQMITSFAAIANGGKLLKPRLVSEKRNANGDVEKTNMEVTGQVMSAEAAAKERQMMIQQVEKGHGYQAKVGGYKVGGKTGTAQVPRKDGSGYDPNKNIGSFIGFAPAQDPRFVVLSKIDSPKGIPWAESSAAPVVGQMLDFLFKYYQIPPTESVN